MKKELLTIENLTVNFRNVPILNHFRLHVYEDEFVLLIGLSGAGKSVLLDVIQGYIPFDIGRIVYDETSISNTDKVPIDIPIHFIREEHCLVDNLTIMENLFILKNTRHKQITFKKHLYNLKTAELFEAFGLQFFPNQPVGTLTKMQKHVIELMKAVVEGSKLIIIDDVIKNYTYFERIHFLKIIEQLRERKYSILFLSRQTQLVQEYADRMIIMRKGEYIRTIFPEGYSNKNNYSYVSGNASSKFEVKKTPEEDPVVLEMSNIRTSRSLTGQSFSLKKNEILGLYDRDNLRNFEIVDVISGNSKIASGRILLDQTPYIANSIEEMVRRGIGIISNHPLKEQLISSLTVYDNVVLNLHKKVNCTNQKMKKYITHELSAELDIKEQEWNLPVKDFNEYIQLKILYNRWLLYKPKVLIVIEPLTKAETMMKNFIFQSLNKFIHRGTPVIVVSSDIKELNEICDRTVDLSGPADEC